MASEGLALDPPPRVREALLVVRAETRARKGEFEVARDDLRAALSTTTSGPARSRLLTRLAQLSFGAEGLLRAAELADLALAEAGDDPRARAHALYVRALVDMNLDWKAALRDTVRRGTHAVHFVGGRRRDGRHRRGSRDDYLRERRRHGGIEQFARAARLFTDSGNLLRAAWPRSTGGTASISPVVRRRDSRRPARHSTSRAGSGTPKVRR